MRCGIWATRRATTRSRWLVGDTLYAISRVLAKEEFSRRLNAGIMTFQLIGVNNIAGDSAVELFGETLFQKDSSKSRNNRNKEKVFETERRIVLHISPSNR